MIITENIIEILAKYLLTINNYNKFFFKNISFYKNLNFLKNLYSKGLVLIYNIFNISLIYKDSLVDIYNLCEKGYVYFVEFINQINITNSFESNSFELTLKDAVIFSYKKTIFTFDNTIKSYISNNNKIKLDIINEVITIINSLSIILNYNIYPHYNNQENIHNQIIKLVNSNNLTLTKIIKKIFFITDLNSKILENNFYNNNNNYIIYFKNINLFINQINENYKLNEPDLKNEFYKNIIIFIEKYINKKIFIKKFNSLYNLDYNFCYLLQNNENINILLNSYGKII